MEFVVVDGDWPVAPYLLPRSRLLTHSVKETDDNGDGSCLLIHGHELLKLCQQLLMDVAVGTTRTVPDLSTLALALVRDTNDILLTNVRIVPPKNVMRHVFAVEDLVGTERLVVFTSRWESPSFASTLLTGTRTAPKERKQQKQQQQQQQQQQNSQQDEDLPSPTRRRLEKSGSRARESSNARLDSLAGRNRSVLQKFTRAETYFTSVSSSTPADLEAVNQLLLTGAIRTDACIESFLCNVCGGLPLQTMTTSCCGAIVCSVCAPASTSSAVFRERTACAVCGEVPLTDPEAHPSRDSEVMRLVQELRVLYYPQLATAAVRHEMPKNPQTSLPFGIHNAGISAVTANAPPPPSSHSISPLCDNSGANTPVLTSIFLRPQ
ncbi:uncharacterized protein TM35_000142670 [Trypanosoma theileri]|uniref:Uncharacterized protein n=1 Tax=Trypanosoma theileri TaxID=67003 RepID=A0A1X0NWH1_9TRYP|nr:uncharacterized protein TM35_000142670 [Trypanosoma theileri]ORC89056.1 hypothetical protein TM35_000142670 [Trypanosoma theileri]